MSGGASPRRKGDRAERELVELLRAGGCGAWRVPLSGAQAGFNGDVLACLQGCQTEAPCVHAETFQSKRLGQGFRRIDAWLQDAYGVLYRADRGEWCVTLRLADLLELLRPGVDHAPPA